MHAKFVLMQLRHLGDGDDPLVYNACETYGFKESSKGERVTTWWDSYRKVVVFSFIQSRFSPPLSNGDFQLGSWATTVGRSRHKASAAAARCALVRTCLSELLQRIIISNSR